MRVNLVRPLLVTIARLDTTATAYDEEFQEPIAGGGDPIGVADRRELDPVTLPAQVEFEVSEELAQSFGGNIPDSRVVLILDDRDLETRGLIDPVSNDPLLGTHDRIVDIRNRQGVVIVTYPSPPGLYIVELRPSTGLDGDRNILLAFCHDRARGLLRGIG